MTDGRQASPDAPDCVDALLERIYILARMLDYGDALAVYAFDPALHDVGRCPVLQLPNARPDGGELEPLIEEAWSALEVYHRQPGMARRWAVGRLHAVIEAARGRVDAAGADAITAALRSPRCSECVYAGCGGP